MCEWTGGEAIISRNDQDEILDHEAEVDTTPLLLREIQALHLLKLRELGRCYRALGDTVWLIMCDIYLHNIVGSRITTDTLKKSGFVAPAQAARYVEILQQEGLVKSLGNDLDIGEWNLELTEAGTAKVQLILQEHR